MSRTVFDLEGRVGLEDKNFISKTKRVLRVLNSLNKALSGKIKSDAGLIKPTRRAAELAAGLKEAEIEAERLEAELRRLESADGVSPEKIEQARSALSSAQQKANALGEALAFASMYGKHGLYIDSKPASILADTKAYARVARDAVAGFGDTFRTAASASPQGRIAKLASGFLKVKDSVSSAGYSVKHFASGVVNDLKRIIPTQLKVGKHFDGIGKHLKKMKKGLFMGAGIKGLAKLGAAGAIALYSVRMLKQGLENLKEYDARTNASINQMSASLTTLKNALATAFAPILNVVAPILSQFIDWLTAAVTAVAHFMAAMTGQSQVTVARKAISGVGSAASGAAASTNDANDAAKEYQKTLLGFDQINKLDEPVSGSGGSGSGGSGAGGAGGAGSMFETVPVSSVMAGWADKIKEAWKNADFYDLGRELGEKLKAGLEAIPWDKIQAVGAKIGKSIATGLNGFFETPDLGQTIGATIAEALNTIVITVNSFTVNFHWDSFGKFIGDSINGFFKTFDWKLTGQTMSGLAKGILDAAIEAVRTVDWRLVGSSIVEMITSIDYIGIATKLVTLLGEAIAGAGNLLSGAIDKLKENLTSYIQSGDLWKDLGNLGSAVIDLSVNIVGAAWELLQSVISAGATVGLALIQSGWTTVTDWVKKKLGDAYVEVSAKLSEVWGSGLSATWETLKGKLKNYGVTFKSILSGTWWAGLGATWKTLKGKLKNYGITFKSRLSAAWTGLKDSWAKLKAAVGEKVAYFKAGLSYKLADLKSKVSDIISKLGGKAVSIGLKFSAAASDLKKWINNNVIDKINSKFSSVPILKNHLIPHLAGGGIQKGRSWKPITQYADGGGAARGQLFVAREAGPELVGTIGSRSAVVNNEQIVASVAAGVAQAVSEVMRNTRNGDQGVNVYLLGDAATIFRVVQQKANDYTRATGQPAFPI